MNMRELVLTEIPQGLPAVYGCMVKGVFIGFPQTNPNVVANFLSVFDPMEAAEGVLWTDENEFMPLADMNCNHEIGFFRVSHFPDEPKEYEPAPPLQSTN